MPSGLRADSGRRQRRARSAAAEPNVRRSPGTALFRLRFPAPRLATWARLHDEGGDDRVERIGRKVRLRGHLTKREFLDICDWKSPRTRPRCALNSASLIREASTVAFAAREDRLKIAALLSLSGVGWPTASVIMHFCDLAQHPILDIRALWSLGFDKPPQYTFDFWVAYCEYARGLARRTRLSMRVIDRALWQYSKKHQPAEGAA